MRKSYIWREDLPYEYDKENDCYKFTHGTRVIKTKSWTELPSPPKPPGVHISVVIVNWNRPLNAVESSITSVLNQDFPPENFEVILVDDASDISPKPVCLKILREYPNHNFRAYLIERTRCWTCMHAYNVGLKRAAGWIVMTMQSEAILDDQVELDDEQRGELNGLKQPVLEGVWRHHNARDKLGLIPHRLNRRNKIKDRPYIKIKDKYYGPRPHFPHDLGLSVRKVYDHGVRGYPEHSVGDSVFDFMLNLTSQFGIKFTEDLNMQVIHRFDVIPDNIKAVAYRVRPIKPGAPLTLKSWLSAKRPDWTGGHWGELTEHEEKNVIRSKTND